MKKSQTWAFIKAIFKDPKSMGAIWPSSVYLARGIAARVPLPEKGYVVELGAGTGVITQALLARGIASDRLIVIERSPELARILREQFPSVIVIEGDAAKLQSLLAAFTPIETIVSGLPLRSLPQSVVNNILQAAEILLAPKGIFVQFTYSWCKKTDLFKERIIWRQATYVWRNFPPARIDRYEAKH